MKKMLPVIVVGLMLLVSCTATDPRRYSYIDRPGNVLHLQRSTVALFRRNALTQDLEGPRCTAFFITDSILATAHHCVEQPTVEVIEIAPGLSFSITVGPQTVIGSTIVVMTRRQFETYTNSDGEIIETYDGTVVADDQVHDIALIRMPAGFISTDILPISSWEPRVGEEVYSMGMPANQPWVLTQGIISTLHPRGVSAGNIVHQATIAPGSSGGPLINNFGDVIGVNVGIPIGATHLGVAIPIHHVVNLLNELNVTVTSSP